MQKVWDGSNWVTQNALKVWTGSTWITNLKLKARTSISWLPTSISDVDVSQVVKWSIEAPTPPPPPPPVTHPVPAVAKPETLILPVKVAATPVMFLTAISGVPVNPVAFPVTAPVIVVAFRVVAVITPA